MNHKDKVKMNLKKCHQCDGNGWTQESEHSSNCDPDRGCDSGCPIPVKEVCSQCDGASVSCCEVIGNIYENKEMLK